MQNGFDDANFVRSFEAVGYDVINIDDRVFYSFDTSSEVSRLCRRLIRAQQTRAFNLEIQKYLRIAKPKIVFVFKAPGLHYETVQLANDLRIPLVVFYPDLEPAVLGKSYVAALRAASAFYHTKPNLVGHFQQTLRSDVRFTYPLYDAKSVSTGDIDSNRRMVLVAHHSTGKLDLLRQINDFDVIDIDVYGSGWPAIALNRVVFHGPLFGPAINGIYRKASFVLGALMERVDGFVDGDVITSRSIQVPAYGGLLIHPYTDAALELYESDECLFTAASDLEGKLTSLLLHDAVRRDLQINQQRAVIAKARSVDSFVNDLILEFGS